MEHQFFRDRLSAYFDHELKNEEHAIVHQHIEECPECQKELAELEKLETLIAEKTELENTDYWEKSAQKIESAISKKPETEIVEIKKTSSKGLWWKLTGVAASLVLVAIFAFEQKDSGDELLMESPKVYDFESDSILNNTPSDSEPELQSSNPIITDDLKELEQDEAFIESDVELQEAVINDKDKIKTKVQNPSPISKSVDNLQAPPQTSSKVKIEDADYTVKDIVPAVNDELAETIVPKKVESFVSEKGRSKTREKVHATSREVEKNLNQSITIKPKEVSDEVDQENQIERPKKLPKKPSAVGMNLQGATSTESGSTTTLEKTSEETQISYWRRKLDKNLQLLKIKNDKRIMYSKTPLVKESKKKESAASVQIDKDFVYKELFEAYYNIAVLTTDTLEENQAVQFLQTYADSLMQSYSSNALHYLQLYKNSKLKQNETKK